MLILNVEAKFVIKGFVKGSVKVLIVIQTKIATMDCFVKLILLGHSQVFVQNKN